MERGLSWGQLIAQTRAEASICLHSPPGSGAGQVVSHSTCHSLPGSGTAGAATQGYNGAPHRLTITCDCVMAAPAWTGSAKSCINIIIRIIRINIISIISIIISIIIIIIGIIIHHHQHHNIIIIISLIAIVNIIGQHLC
jgi:hypothetical protein